MMIEIKNITCFLWSSAENAELFCSERMLPVNLQTNLRSKQDTQMNNYVILTTSEEEEETFSLLKTSKTLEVLS